MLTIPAGEYAIGWNGPVDVTFRDEDRARLGARAPRVVKTNAFLMDEACVTYKQYAVFYMAHCRDRCLTPPLYWDAFLQDYESYGNKPVCVAWRGALAYEKWAGKRLPFDHEWEIAARCPDGRLFPREPPQDLRSVDFSEMQIFNKSGASSRVLDGSTISQLANARSYGEGRSALAEDFVAAVSMRRRAAA